MPSYVDMAAIGSALFAGVSAVIAAISVIMQSRTQQSERYLDQAVLTLRNAYEALTVDEKVKCERLDWLTCARHLVRYSAIKALISRKSHLLICEEQEEYWRHKFYLSLRSGILNQPGFYAVNRNTSKEPIEPKSAIIVHHFATWPDGLVDPINFVDDEALLVGVNVLNGNIGLKLYLESLPRYQEIIERMKQQGLIR